MLHGNSRFSGFSAAACGAVLLSMSTVSGPAAAANLQILGLVATAGPVKLDCADGVCSAELSTICLQKDRTHPGFDAPYRVHAGGGIDLTVTASDGAQKSVRVDDAVSVRTVRGYTTVRVSLPESRVRGMGGGNPSLNVGGNVSLVPVVTEKNPVPPGSEEIAQASSELRPIATEVFDQSDGHAEAARMVGELINAAPPAHLRLSEAERTELWNELFGGKPSRTSPLSVKRAWRTFSACRDDLRMERMYGYATAWRVASTS